MYKQLSILQDMMGFVHRISPEQLLRDLPAKHEHVVLVCLDTAQQRMYQAYLDVSHILSLHACLPARLCSCLCLPVCLCLYVCLPVCMSVCLCLSVCPIVPSMSCWDRPPALPLFPSSTPTFLFEWQSS